MDDAIQNVPEAGLKIGITTNGRKSGRPHRREVRLYNLDGRFYITGSPGQRDWYANLLADPRFTVHLNGMRLPETAHVGHAVGERLGALSERARRDLAFPPALRRMCDRNVVGQQDLRGQDSPPSVASASVGAGAFGRQPNGDELVRRW